MGSVRKMFECVALAAFGLSSAAFTPGAPPALWAAGVGIATLVGVVASEFAKARPESGRKFNAIRRKVKERIDSQISDYKTEVEIQDVDQANDVLAEELLKCVTNPETLVEAAADPSGFPAKATELVMVRLANRKPALFGNSAPQAGRDYAKEVIFALLWATIEHPDFFAKVQAPLNFMVLRNVARIEDKLDRLSGVFVTARSEPIDVQPPLEAKPQDKNPSDVSRLKSGFAKLMSDILGEEWPSRSFASSPLWIPDSTSRKIVRVCADFLPQLERLSSGRDASASTPLLDEIIKLAELAYREGAPDAKQLYFDAVDQRVHAMTYVGLPETLEGDAVPYLHTMAALATNDGVDVELLRRYWARNGDVLKICGSDDAFANDRALRALRQATELSGANLGYHAFRSLCIAAARSNITDAEFDKIVSALEDVLASGRLTDHERAHILDGGAEAYAHRYKKTKKRSYGRAALEHWQHARLMSMAASARDGEHIEFSLKIEKQLATLAQAGIVEPFGSNTTDVRDNVQQHVIRTLKRAKKAGSLRVVEQMNDALTHVNDIKG